VHPEPTFWSDTLVALPGTGLLFAYALLFALAEIEIEGEHGWAMKLPTWFRRTSRLARVYGRLLSGKPLTGYHVVMFLLTLTSFHIGLAFGQPWSPGLEARLLASYLTWGVTWDFLWFLFNPGFGWARFRKGGIWWHGGRWLGRLPIDYVNVLGVSLLVAALPGLVRGNLAHLRRHAIFVGTMLAFVGLAALAAPFYRRFYRHMRRPGADERPQNP